ncbi:MAG: oxidoreductase [Flavobacteriaceae bacterium]|jgi:photosystem II stability/assembly factor-like uncharacterized protein|nr:oxidoreductase [Flavobacteriaceae bacterium]
MKYIITALVLFLFSVISKDTLIVSKYNQSGILIDTLFIDNISIRAIEIDKNKVWYAADKNRFGYIDLVTNNRIERKISLDSLKLEFRSIAQNKNSIFILSVGNPALLYKIDKHDLTYKLVYRENHKKVFYDAIHFIDNKKAIAIGDPTEDTFSIITTLDGGTTWNKLSNSRLPKLAVGEAAFAASNTNICIKRNRIFIVSGGIKSRLFVSDNFCKTWQVYETPIIQGQTMTGIFSADFLNEKIGIIVGGNYENQLDNKANKAITFDGGQTWKLIGINQGFGYASCVQFVPDSNGNSIMSVGTTGIYSSNNQGENWKKLSEDKDIYTFRFQNSKIAYLAGKNKLVRMIFN